MQCFECVTIYIIPRKLGQLFTQKMSNKKKKKKEIRKGKKKKPKPKPQASSKSTFPPQIGKCHYIHPTPSAPLESQGGSRGRGTVGSIRTRLLWAGTQLCYGCVIIASELKEMETLTLWNLFRSWWWLNREALTKECFQQVFGIWSAARSFH